MSVQLTRSVTVMLFVCAMLLGPTTVGGATITGYVFGPRSAGGELVPLAEVEVIATYETSGDDVTDERIFTEPDGSFIIPIPDGATGRITLTYDPPRALYAVHTITLLASQTNQDIKTIARLKRVSVTAEPAQLESFRLSLPPAQKEPREDEKEEAKPDEKEEDGEVEAKPPDRDVIPRTTDELLKS